GGDARAVATDLYPVESQLDLIMRLFGRVAHPDHRRCFLDKTSRRRCNFGEHVRPSLHCRLKSIAVAVRSRSCRRRTGLRPTSRMITGSSESGHRDRSRSWTTHYDGDPFAGQAQRATMRRARFAAPTPGPAV